MSKVFGQPLDSNPGHDERDGPRAGTPGGGEPGTPGGYGPGAPGGYEPGAMGGYEPSAPGAHGPGGHGDGGYGEPGGPGSQGRDRRGRKRRRRILLGGASLGVAAALAFAGLGAANAFGATTLTTSQIQAKVDPGVVDVVSTLGYQGGTAAGTGMVLTSNGEVLTNNHVIEGATAINVTDAGNGRTYTATVVGYDKTRDVAVLQLTGASGLKTVSLSTASARTGQTVVALGNAGGKGGTPSAATGTVTAVNQAITVSDQPAGTAEQLTGLTRTSAAIQPGDSGGPLVNSYGQVIGMNTAASAAISPTGSPAQPGQAQTQAFAIPISEASSIASQIEAGTSSSAVHIGSTAFLGAEILPSGAGIFGGASPAASGAAVAGVVSGSAAAQAGLTEGDQITSLAGQAITSSSDLSSVLANYHPGNKVSISWTDQPGQSHTATVVLTTGPAG